MLLLLAGCDQSLLLHSVDLSGATTDIPATLSMPSGTGPFPAAVLMHGCGGDGGGTQLPVWEAWFNSHGYAVLRIDSYTGRGEDCSNKYFSKGAGTVEREADAAAGLKYLAGNPKIDSKRTVLVGFSHGGTTVLMASLNRPVLPFAGFIALYPDCTATGVSDEYVFTAPTMILIGADDNWTPADPCKFTAQRAKGPFELHVYPGAYHAFDRPGPALTWMGYFIGGGSQATLQAHIDVENFLKKLGSGAT